MAGGNQLILIVPGSGSGSGRGSNPWRLDVRPNNHATAAEEKENALDARQARGEREG